MANRTPAEALAAYVDSIGAAVRCVARSAILVTDWRLPADASERGLNPVRGAPWPVSNVRGDRRFLFRVHTRFRVVQASAASRAAWNVESTAYEFSIETDEERELLTYHWHPGEDAFDEPHLHVEGGQGEIPRRAHLPTGRVEVEDVVLLLIREFGVSAVQAYGSVLHRTRRQR